MSEILENKESYDIKELKLMDTSNFDSFHFCIPFSYKDVQYLFGRMLMSSIWRYTSQEHRKTFKVLYTLSNYLYFHSRQYIIIFGHSRWKQNFLNLNKFKNSTKYAISKTNFLVAITFLIFLLNLIGPLRTFFSLNFRTLYIPVSINL